MVLSELKREKERVVITLNSVVTSHVIIFKYIQLVGLDFKKGESSQRISKQK